MSDCSCIDYVNEDGEGNCLKPYEDKPLFCYVKQPSSCPDIIESVEVPNYIQSTQACKLGK